MYPNKFGEYIYEKMMFVDFYDVQYFIFKSTNFQIATANRHLIFNASNLLTSSIGIAVFREFL